MSNKDKPAFPESVAMNDYTSKSSKNRSLTKREYFAIKICTGMMATPDSISNRKISAEIAVEVADHLIKALEQDGE